MEQAREFSEAREIEKSLNFAIWFLVGCSLYSAFSIWYFVRSIHYGHWFQVPLGAAFFAMGALSIFRAVLRIKEIVRNLLPPPSSTL
jgi:hypothetical protein